MSTTATEVRRGLPPVMFSLLILSLLILGTGLFLSLAEPTTRDEIGVMLRWTARLSFAFLILAFVARPLVQLFGTGRWLLANRRYIGLSFAFSHTIHFIYVVRLGLLEPLELPILIGGGLAFVLMWAMAATSNDKSMRALKRNWKRLHLVGIYYLWLIFMQSFAGRIGADDPYMLYTALTVAGFVAWLLRIAAFWKKRSKNA